MVTFAVERKDAFRVVYRYSPESRTDYAYGTISVYLENGKIMLDTAAEKDFIVGVSAKEQKEMQDSMRQMLAESGEVLPERDMILAEPEDTVWYYYAEHVMRRLKNEMEKGSLPDEGTVMWY